MTIIGRVMPPEWNQRDRVNAFAFYEAGNDLGFPSLPAVQLVPERLVAFHDRPHYGPDAAVHFFVDDYRFERLWDKPERYLEQLGEAAGVLTPDFSVFADWPIAMQIWQTYRARWIGAHLTALGFTVIPSVTWSVPADFFFESLPRRSVLAVATTGIRRDEERRDHFRAGWHRIVDLEPTCVLVYGGLDDVIDEPGVPVREFPSFTDEWAERKKKERDEWADGAASGSLSIRADGAHSARMRIAPT